ncbi:MAG TPA: YdcF family protein [Myxococcota bacterium]|nr:YdcF family protein [Myxococcota bacterium]
MPTLRWNRAPASAASANGHPIATEEENRPAQQRIQGMLRKPALFVVPGYTPVKTTEPIRLHEISQQRVRSAVEQAPKNRLFLFSGGNVHPDNTPYNEAYEMKQFAMRSLGIPEEEILIDPYARHSTTNLRNAGRFMKAFGYKKATIVTSFDQAFYYGFQIISSFELRCRAELGYSLGEMKALDLDLSRLSFCPSDEVDRAGSDPLDP